MNLVRVKNVLLQIKNVYFHTAYFVCSAVPNEKQNIIIIIIKTEKNIINHIFLKGKQTNIDPLEICLQHTSNIIVLIKDACIITENFFGSIRYLLLTIMC